MICEGCDPRCKSCEGAGNYDPVCTECNPEFYLYQGFCFTDCPDGWMVDVTTNNTCTRIVYEIPETTEVESDQDLALITKTYNATESLLCSSKGYQIHSAGTIKFPFIILLVVMGIITLISYFLSKKTRITATLIMLIAPVEVLALAVQCYFAYRTEGLTGINCIDPMGDEI